MNIWNHLTLKKILVVSILITFPTVLSANGIARDTLRLCSNNVFPPYEFFNEDGEPDGFDIDILKALMKKIGRPYTMKLYRWDVAQQRFLEGKEDVLMGVFRHEGLLHKYKYGVSYASLYHAAIYRRGSKVYNNFGSMKGKKVLLERGDGMEILMRKNGLSKEIVYVDNMVDGLKMLSAGKADLAIGAMEMANFVIKTYDLKNLDMNGLEMLPEEFSFVCNDEKTLAELDKAMIDIRKDGTYQMLYDKWFINYGKSKIWTIVLFSICGTFLIALISLILINILRKKIAEGKEELKQRNLELEHSNEKMKLAITTSNLAFWEFHFDHNTFHSYNEKILKNNGKALDFMRTMEKLIHPDDIAIMREQEKQIKEKKVEMMKFQVRIWYDTDRQWHYNTITAVPYSFSEDGTPERFVGFRHDDTEQVRLNEDLREYAYRLNYTLKSCDIYAWYYDIGSGLFTIKSSLGNQLESISFNEYFKRIDPDDLAKAKEMYLKVLSGEEKEFHIQLKLKQFITDEKIHYILYNGIPQYDDNKKLIGFFGISRDVTGYIDIQQRLEAEKLKAEEADALKTAFLANMSHEIRTPLNSIVGFSQILQDTEDKDQRKMFIDIINENTNNLLRLIDGILELSKIEAGVMDIQNNYFDMADYLNIVVSSIRDLWKDNGVELIVDNPYAQCVINSDSNCIAEILTNFGTNAIKYTAKGYIKIGYSWNNGILRLYVEDTGTGIAKENQVKIFDRFEKVNSFVQGSGLGLSICKAIAEGCGGEIGVESEVGSGSTFWATIPCERKE